MNRDRIHIVVRGEPAVYRERSRVYQPPGLDAKARVWSSRTTSTKNAQAHIRYEAQQAMAGRAPLDCPVRLVLCAYFAPPPSWPKWKVELLALGRLAHTQKPDMCNLRKAAVDALSGVVIRDDSLICAESDRSGKFWDCVPRLEIMVEPLVGMVASQTKRRPADGPRSAREGDARDPALLELGL